MSQNLPVAENSSTPQLQVTVVSRGLFFASLVWLGCLAVVFHFHESPFDANLFWTSVISLLVIWPIFWWDVLQQRRRDPQASWLLYLQAVLPVLRLGRRRGDPPQVWLPRLGWRTVERQLQSDLEDLLNQPMLAISLLVLPVILVEYLLADAIQNHLWLSRTVQGATAVIWWAFTIEFVLMVSVTEKKLAYCKQHWIDLAIILLPLLAFLRALRLGRLLRLQSLGKTARMYKLRGVAMRSYRALLVVDLIQRLILGGPEKRLQRLKHRLAEQEAHLETMRAEIAELEAELSSQQAASSVVRELPAA
ncbi:hypothetical protein GC163_04865 [bacterium]|nr:hypothetical protein [bacterium]